MNNYDYSMKQKFKDLLDTCEKYTIVLGIPYFTMINNVYEPFKNGDMNEYNRGFIQEIYEKGIFDQTYRNAFIQISKIDKSIKNWVVPIVLSDDLSKLDGRLEIDCLDIYNYINLSDPFTVYGNIYNLFQSENKCEMYVVSQHKRKEGTCKFYGQKVILSDLIKNDNKYLKLDAVWLTEGLDSIKEVNTSLANDYISNFFNNNRIPQTKFKLGEEFFISRLIDDFKEIINEDNLDMDKLRINDLLETIKTECSTRG